MLSVLLGVGAAVIYIAAMGGYSSEPDYGMGESGNGGMPPIPTPDPDPEVEGDKPVFESDDGVPTLENKCAYEKPQGAITYNDVVVGPGKQRLEIPIMNAFAGCSTPLHIKMCVRMGAPLDAGFIGGVPDKAKPSSRGFDFKLNILGDADGNPQVVQVSQGKPWECWPEEVKAKVTVSGKAVDGAAGLQLIFDGEGYHKKANIWIDASG